MDAARAMGGMSGVGCGMSDGASAPAGGAPLLRLIGGDEARGGAAHGGGGPGKRARRRAVRAGEGGKTGGERVWNAAEYLTSYPVPGGHGIEGVVTEFSAVSQTRATVDKADRAHQVRDGGSGLLRCASELEKTMSRPRRYPAHQMTSRGVAFDSAFDELHRRQLSLAGVSGVGSSGVQRETQSEMALRMAGYEAARRGCEVRDLVRRRLNESSMGDSETAVEAYAQRVIAMHAAKQYVPEDGGWESSPQRAPRAQRKTGGEA